MTDAAKYRQQMKDKARRIAGADPSGPVDASSWTPPEPLNADVKTGLRPVSRRQFKRGGRLSMAGEVSPLTGDKAANRSDRVPRRKGGGIGEDIADAWMNRNVKQANEDRPGKKHIGGMKKGGSVDHDDEAADRALIKKMVKPGARTGKQYGGAGMGMRGMSPADVAMAREMLRRRGMTGPAMSPVMTGMRKKGGRAEHADGGRLTKGQLNKLAAHHNWGSVAQGDDDIIAWNHKQGAKDGDSGWRTVTSEQINEALKPRRSERADGGRTKHSKGCTCASCGGRAKASDMMDGRSPRKAGGRTKGKTNINIVVSAGRPGGDQQGVMGTLPVTRPLAPPMPVAPPVGAAPPLPGGLANVPPPPGGAPMPMLRKAGGRTYRSYKDMDAGALSGFGRLEKTEIQRRKRTS